MPDTLMTSEPVRVARRSSDASATPLADLCRSYLDRQREFDQAPHSDDEVEAFGEAQERLLDEVDGCPAVTPDDLLAKLALIAEQTLAEAGERELLDRRERQVLTLSDDVRRVLGATADDLQTAAE